jgi:hypothetical protein
MLTLSLAVARTRVRGMVSRREMLTVGGLSLLGFPLSEEQPVLELWG